MRRTIVTLLLLFLITNAHASSGVFLERNGNPKRKKHLDSTRYYSFVVKDGTYYARIVGFTDSSLSITGLYETTADARRAAAAQADSAWLARNPPGYMPASATLPFDQLQAIKKDWFKNKGWLRPFPMFLIGALLGVAFLPVAAADKGIEGVKEWAVFEGILLAIALPPLFIGTRKTNWNLEKKWTIKVEG